MSNESPFCLSNYAAFVSGRYEKEVMLAIDLALAAGKHAKAIRLKQHINTWHKDNGDIVTEADIAAEKIIISGIKSHFSSDGILSEESGSIAMTLLDNPEQQQKTWVIDPIDGTSDYSKGRDGYSVMIGLLHHGAPVMGVVFQPDWNRCYWGSCDSGAWLLSDQAAVTKISSNTTTPSKFRVASSRSNRNSTLLGMIEQLDIDKDTQIGSVGVKAGLVANNEADIYLTDSKCHYWDTVAPQIILEAAGGIFTLLNGSSIAYPLNKIPRHNCGLLASGNDAIHKTALSRLE